MKRIVSRCAVLQKHALDRLQRHELYSLPLNRSTFASYVRATKQIPASILSSTGLHLEQE